MPFGTASYAVLENSGPFPEYRLERSLEPELAQVNLAGLIKRKLVSNTRQILQNDLPRLTGTWVSGFFLTGLLVAFKSPSLRRLRYFLVITLLVTVVVQALGRTQLSEDSPDINSEN